MVKNTVHAWLAFFILLIGFSSCQDDFLNGLESEGGSGVNLLVDFMPVADADLKTRAMDAMPGDGMGNIDDMCIVIFDSKGNYFDMVEVKDSMYVETLEKRDSGHTSNGLSTDDTLTVRRKIKLYYPMEGEYYIYAVANLGTVDAEGKHIQTTKGYLDEVKVGEMTREEFRKLRRKWDPANYRNNSEMSGIFTLGETPGSHAYTGVEEKPTKIYPGVNLHCWLRRLASKVTVDFDATNLSHSTTVYIREIRVRDIPYDCSLVEKNTVSEKAAVNTPNGLMGNDKSSHGIQTCKSADLAGMADTTHQNWLALQSGVPTIEAFLAQCKDEELKKQLENINHTNTGKCIFFYENMQGDGESKLQDADGGPNGLPDGKIDSPNSWHPDSLHYKDEKRAGTYVEVIAYYESFDPGNEGSGNIIYRFMLGKNVEDNYDVERNHHYRLTLCFNGYANDVDWHIEYDRAQPTVTIPKEYYISYGYNEMTELPIKVSGEIVGNKMTVEIIRNDWYPSNTWEDTRPGPMGVVEGGIFVDPKTVTRANEADTANLSVGFLSLRRTHASAAGAGKELSYLYRLWMGDGDSPDYVRNEFIDDAIYKAPYVPDEYKDKYTKKRSLGFRAYHFDGVEGNFSGEKHYKERGDADTADGSYRLWTKAGVANKIPRQTTVYVPLFTRNRNLVKTTGYTGENPYNVFQRRARIRVKFEVRKLDGTSEPINEEVAIIQATKLANPMGVWRAWNNAAPFDVHLKYLDGRKATTYTPLTSKAGGWSAEVEQGKDWILLNGGKRKIYGGEGSEIRFTYRPAGILSGPEQTRCGIITVRYHNYSCIHKIFVRQGYAPIQLRENGPFWHSFNLVTKDREGISPIDEGSLFRYGNLDYPIDADNNVNDTAPWINIKPNMWKNHADDDLSIAGGGNETKKWHEIISSKPNRGDTGWKSVYQLENGPDGRMPTVREIAELRDDPTTTYQFGVIYGDDATATGDNIDEAYRYKAAHPATHSYGMRGCVIYNVENANQIFLPIGSSGYGVRKEGRATFIEPGTVALDYGWGFREVGRGIVRYSTSRISYMPKENAKNMPLLYDIFKSFGANYWLYRYETTDPLHKDERAAIDFNYNTFDFNTIGIDLFRGFEAGKATYGSDACFIRLVNAN